MEYIDEHITFLRGLMEKTPLEERGSEKAKRLALEVRRLEKSVVHKGKVDKKNISTFS